jgi:predicted MFS family arabinose efflux permease
VIGLGVAAAALSVAFVTHLRRAPEPLIPLDIFANRVVDKAAAAMFFGMLVYISATVYLPLYFELCLGLDPTKSGLALIVVLGASVIGSNFTGMNLPRVKHYKRMGNIGLPIGAAGLAALALFAPQLNIWGALLFVLIYGLGLGALFPTLTVCVQNAVDPRDMGAATATLAFVRSLGSALGVAVFGAVIFAYGLVEPGAGGQPDPAVALTAFRVAFGLMAAAIAVSFAFFAAMEERPLRGPAAHAPEPETI